MSAVSRPALGRAAARTAIALGSLTGTTSCQKAPDHSLPVARCTPPASPFELELERALPIEADGNFQPSGLLMWQGRLLTVSDKHDRTVFMLALGRAEARASPLVRFEAPAAGARKLDWEGLALDNDGSFLLASEGHYRVLTVTRTGESDWRTASLEEAGRRAGLFRAPNAGLEGLAALPNGELLLAAERHPRGLLQAAGTPPHHATRVWLMERGSCRPAPGRSFDFSDLTTFEGSVYALERNAHLVVQLRRHADGYVMPRVWSFGATENDPRFAYQDRTFGLAEGLAIDREHVFVVLDNNGDQRAADRADRRPLLFVFRRPAG
jgi:hypothetical protein